MPSRPSFDHDAPQVRVSRLDRTGATGFLLEPDAGQRAALADELELLQLRKLRFEGRLEPEGKRDVTLSATLGATVVQPCVVTLAPVTTRIDIDVTRRFLADMPEPEADEVEMPEDDTAEPLPDVIDLRAVMTEALALALPQYPRAGEAELGEAVFAEPGTEPLRDADLKPLAGLAGLRDKLAGKDEKGD